MKGKASVIHLNVVNFPAQAEILRDNSLREKAFAVAVPGAYRALVIDVSRQALSEGIEPGMRLEEAERRLPGLLLLPPSPDFYARLNQAIEKTCACFAPLLENSGGGHFFLDIQGTRSLFGAYLDTAARIRSEVAESVGLYAATALATNKLVAKVGTRSLRPEGLISVREGEETSFLRHQDIYLLPGVGLRLKKIFEAVGITEIGNLASLSDGEVMALLGKPGLVLRDSARGVDLNPVQDGSLAARVIEEGLRFNSEVLEDEAITAALILLVERCGFKLRQDKLGAKAIRIEILYIDEVRLQGWAILRQALALDGDLYAASKIALARAKLRRVRVAALSLSLARLEPSGLQLDLFSPEPAFPFAVQPGPSPGGPPRLARVARLQEAIDATRKRYGCDAITRGASLSVAAFHNV